MRAARVISGVVAESVAQTGDAVTMPQLRTLVLVASRPEVNASAIAASLGVHLSNASRLCDRLVRAGLLHRRQSETDRRNLVLTLTPAGASLVGSIMEHRRLAFARLLARLSPPCRAGLVTALDELSNVAGEPAEIDLRLP